MVFGLAHITTHTAAIGRMVRAGTLTLLMAASFPAAAQVAESGALLARSRPLNVAVIGDSVANDLGRGLEDLFDGKRHVQIVKKTRFATGLVRTDYFNWDDTVAEFLRHHNPDVIVVVIGGNDRQAIRLHDRRLDALTKPWLLEYERLVSRFMNQFRSRRTQVYWVSLPPVRSGDLTHAYRIMNNIYRREAARHGFRYLSVWNEFLTNGAYSSFGESLEGVRRPLRKEDGMHFTAAGRVLLASYVANAIGLR